MLLRKFLILFIPSLAIIMVFATVAIGEAQRTPAWQNTLGPYANSIGAEVEQVAQANKPWQFMAAVETERVDAGPFDYSADITYSGPETYSLALPYPPQKVYCVQLDQNGRQKIVFMSYYSDNLWQSGWVIQQGKRPDTINQLLTAVDCQLKL